MIRRVGLAGFGAIAENAYLRALRGLGVAIASVAEVAPARRAAAERLLPGVPVFDKLERLLDENQRSRKAAGLDALIVTTPPNSHVDAVRLGLKAGLAVLCEKPLTLDPAAFEKIRAESRSRNLAVYSVNNWAYAPQWDLLLKTAASGALGAVRHTEIRVLRTRPSAAALPGDWRKDPAIAGGGILVDHGWHGLYLLRRLLGPRATLVCAVLQPADAVDEAAVVLLSAPGATGVMHLSWKAAERSNTALVIGEKGSLELRDDSIGLRLGGGAPETIRFPEKLSAGSAHPDWLAAMWPAFEAEASGAGLGENLEEAAFCLEMIRAAYASRQTARV